MKKIKISFTLLLVVFLASFCKNADKKEAVVKDLNNIVAYEKNDKYLSARFFNYRKKTLIAFMLINKRKIKKSIFDFSAFFLIIYQLTQWIFLITGLSEEKN